MMRNGDFSEVLAINPAFRIYDPATGDPVTGAGRTAFADAIIPANRISAISKEIQAMYPEPNNPGTNSGLQNNYFAARFPKAIRDNYDGKVNWNRNPSHQFWGKFSVMKADVMDLFYLPFDEAGGGKTTVSLWTVGSTWTLSPTLLLDANGGSNKMTHNSNGPGLRHQLRPGLRHSRAEQRRASPVRARPISSATAACRFSRPASARWATTRPGRPSGARKSATPRRST